MIVGKGEDAGKSILIRKIEIETGKKSDASNHHHILKMELGKPSGMMTVEPDMLKHMVLGKTKQMTTLADKPKHKVPVGKQVLVRKREPAVGTQVLAEHSKQVQAPQ